MTIPAENPTANNAELILKELKKVRELARHIQNVQNACFRMGEKLIEDGEVEFGRNLIANSFIHDQTKFRGIEWVFLVGRNCENSHDLPNAVMNHVSSNPHHPEYWGDIHKMPEIYVAEMVADWWSRSIEFGTDLRDWVSDTATKKFNFTMQQNIGRQIKKYMNLILDQPFK